MMDIVQKLTRWTEVISFEKRFGDQVRSAGLFDDEHYKLQLPDKNINRPLRHYLLHGWKKRLSPHPRINTEDIASGWGYFGWVETISPLEGYWRTGRFFGLDFSGVKHKQLLRSLLQPVKWAEKRNDKVVVLHAYYLPETRFILEAIAPIIKSFDLVITTPHQSSLIRSVLKDKGLSGSVVNVPNIGRDIFPFVHLVNHGLLSKYEFIGKLHSKRSLHRSDAKEWLQNSVDCIIENAKKSIMPENVGMVAPVGTLTGKHNLSANVKHLNWLCAKSGFNFDAEQISFAAGSMFWARSSALALIKELDLSLCDFEGECGQLDGTLAHALERFFGLSCIKSRLTLIEAS